MINIGTHLSISGGLDKAAKKAGSFGYGTFQIFSQNPRGRGSQELTPDIIADFRHEIEKAKIKSFYIHTPYYTNFASPEPKKFHASVGFVQKDLARIQALGGRYFIMHIGNHMGQGKPLGLHRVIEGLDELFSQDKTDVFVLLENTAGQGTEIGSDFTTIGQVIKGVKNNQRLKVCLDTCHSFAAGYDWTTTAGTQKAFAEFDREIGLDRLQALHLNDSKTSLGDHKDRHERIGQGKIGLTGIKNILSYPKIKSKDLILETPGSDADRHADVQKIISLIK